MLIVRKVAGFARFLIATSLLLLAACGGGGGGGGAPPNIPPPVAQDPVPPPLDPTGQSPGEFFALTNRNRFITFTPGQTALSTNLPITGIGNSEQIVALDVRTLDGTVYVFSNFGILYTLDPRSGAAQRVAQLQSMPTGSAFGMEFIAAPEQLRIVSNDGNAFVVNFNLLFPVQQQSRLDVFPLLSTLPSGITEIAGTRNAVRCGGTATLYYLDTARDQLLVEDPQGEDLAPRSVGAFGVDAEASSGFEIFQREDDSDAALVVLRVSGSVSLYDLDLNSGRASVRTALPGLRTNETVVGLARPAPQQQRARVGSTVALTASGKLISFDERAPAALCGPPVAITGLQEGESLLDIDMRPADGLVYGLSNAGRIYTINTQLQSLGTAKFASTLEADPVDLINPFDGTIDPTINIDFSPREDRLVTIDATNRISRIDVDNGFVNTDDFIFLSNGGPFEPVGIGSFAPSPNRALKFGLNLFGTAPNNRPQSLGPTQAIDIRGSDGLILNVMQPQGAASSVLEISSFISGRVPSMIGGGEPVIGITSLPRPRATVFALTINNRLLVLNPSAPEIPESIVQLSGIQSGDTLLAIDFRPIDGALYGLTERGRIHVIDPATGVATLRSTLTPANNDTTFETFVNLEADISFSPLSGQLRVSVTGGRSLRVDVDTGRVITDARLSRANSLSKPPAFAGIAYLSPVSGDTFGKLVLLDSANQRVAGLLGPGVTVPRTLREISRLDAQVTNIRGFDIVSNSSGLLLADTAQERHVLFEVDLGSGNVRYLRLGAVTVPADAQVTGFAANFLGQRDPLFAVLDGRRLITFSNDLQQAPSAPVIVAGLAPGETLLSIDLDNSGSLRGLGSTGSLYAINPTTGAATLPLTLSGDTLQGTRFEMDFDRFGTELTIASDTGQLVSVDAAGRATARTPAYVGVAATPIAHSNSFPGLPRATSNKFTGAPRTARLFIDTASASLLASNQNTFGLSDADDTSAGDLVSVVPILPPFDFRSFSPFAGFDVIGGRDALALAALQPDVFERSVLYSIDLGTFGSIISNAGDPIGPIGPPGTGPIRGLAIRLQ